MLRILFCDDDPAFAARFLPLVKEQTCKILDLGDKELCCAYFEKGADLLAHLEKSQADILFLDIDMPEMSGFELARALNERETKPLLIFVSAYDNFVYSAFEFFPFAYLRKERADSELPFLLARIKRQREDALRRLVLQTSKGELTVHTEDILYFESEHNYYRVHMTDGTSHLCRGALSKIEKELQSLDFFRIHSAYAVNLLYVKPCAEKGLLQIGQIKVPLAQKRAADFKKALSNYTRRRLGL